MIDFGFKLSPSSRIDLDKVDRTLLKRIADMEPDFKKCMACGSCSATCSAGAYKATSMRRAILALQNGLTNKALEELESCMLCGKCTLVCPRGINTRHLILSIQKICGEK
ncbi:MAG: 4Fe-4S dicluster domain-containing protein [Candidatus Egerieousia sp.]